MEWDDQPTYLFRNLGRERGVTVPRFAEVAEAAGLRHRDQGRAILHFDYDNDGDQDLVIFNHGAPPSLFRNDTDGGHWLRVRTAAWGARVTVTAGGRQQARTVGVGGYFGTSELIAHFGLGDHAGATQVAVALPDGRVVRRDLASPDRTLEFGPASPR